MMIANCGWIPPFLLPRSPEFPHSLLPPSIPLSPSPMSLFQSCGVFDLDRFPVTVATQAMDIVSRLALLGREFYPSIDQ